MNDAGAEAGSAQGGSRLSRKAFEMLLFRAGVLPVGLATTIVTSRFLLPEGRGAYVIGLLTVTLTATFIGIGTSVTYEVGRGDEELQQVLRRGLALSAILGVALGAVLLPLNRSFAGDEYGSIQLFALGLPALLLVQAVGGGLVAVGRLRLWNVAQVLAPAAILAGLLGLVVVVDAGVRGAVVGWLAAQWLVAGVVLFGSRDLWLRGNRAARVSLARWRPILRLALQAGLVNLVALLNYRIALFVLERAEGLEAVGIYSLSMSLAELLWLLSSTLTVVVVAPALRADASRAADVVSQAVRHSLILTVVFAAVLAGVGAAAIPTVFGEPFRGSVEPLLLLLPGIVAYAPCNVLSMYFSMRLGRMRFPLLAAGVSALVTGLLCLALVPPFGPSGAAVSSTVGFTVGGLLLAAVFRRRAGVAARELVPRPSDGSAYTELVRALLRR